MPAKTILIVDDEQFIINIMLGALRTASLDAEILTAASGEEALQVLRSRPVEVLVTDYLMIGMDGLELIGAARSIRPETRVILITAYSSAALELEARRLQVLRFLTKPLEIAEFRQVVQQALGDSPPARPTAELLSEEHYRQVVDLLEQLRLEINARCLCVCAPDGRVIVSSGHMEPAALEAAGRVSARQMTAVQPPIETPERDPVAAVLVYQEGSRLAQYSVNIGRRFILLIIMERSQTNTRLDTVWFHARHAAAELDRLLAA